VHHNFEDGHSFKTTAVMPADIFDFEDPTSMFWLVFFVDFRFGLQLLG
jgi:hypothetical protein